MQNGNISFRYKPFSDKDDVHIFLYPELSNSLRNWAENALKDAMHFWSSELKDDLDANPFNADTTLEIVCRIHGAMKGFMHNMDFEIHVSDMQDDDLMKLQEIILLESAVFSKTDKWHSQRVSKLYAHIESILGPRV